LKNLVPTPPEAELKKRAIKQALNNKKPRKKGISPGEFGPYQKLMALRLKIDALPRPLSLKPLMLADAAIYSIVAGYFEFAPRLKADHYRQARIFVSRLWQSLELARITHPALQTEFEDLNGRILDQVLPGISGAVRKVESFGAIKYGERSYGKKPEPKTAGAHQAGKMAGRNPAEPPEISKTIPVHDSPKD